MLFRKASTSKLRTVAQVSTVLLAGSVLATACGGDDDDDDGTGGVSARGGSAGKGGASANGGTASGSAGKGGALGKGGNLGDGGSLATAGTGDGGDAGDAGDSGAGGAGQGGNEGGAAGVGGEGGGQSTLANPCRGIELPEGEFYVAPDLCVRAVATAQGRLRQITFASNGDLIGVTKLGNIVRYRDVNDDGVFADVSEDGTVATEIVTIGSIGGQNGNNAHLDEVEGYLYVGTQAGVARFPYSAEDVLGDREDVVVGQPSTGTHAAHTVHVYGDWLYVHSGSENNAVAPASPEYDLNRSVLKRFALEDFDPGEPFDWTEGEVFVRGIRNMVGFTQNAAGRMYGVVNGIDNLMYAGEDVHLDNPGEDLIRLQNGGAHGYPYCFTAAHVLDSNGDPIAPGTQLAAATDASESDPDFVNPRDDEWCAENSDEPVTFLPAHSAPLDITFFDGPEGNLPEAWRGAAFVALHGSWNTTPSVGHKVVFVPFNSSGEAPMPEADAEQTEYPFPTVFGGGNATTPDDGSWGWSAGEVGEDPVRPVGVAISPVDGALYVSSDNAADDAPGTGAIYRIGLARD
jgi:glucose/arabinose dehydrogenase